MFTIPCTVVCASTLLCVHACGHAVCVCVYKTFYLLFEVVVVCWVFGFVCVCGGEGVIRVGAR